MPRKPRSPITEEEKAEMIRLYVEEGYGYKAIAKMVLGNQGTATVRKVLKAAGVPPRSAEEGKKMSPSPNGRRKSREQIFKEERDRMRKRKGRPTHKTYDLPLFKEAKKRAYTHRYKTDMSFKAYQVIRSRFKKIVKAKDRRGSTRMKKLLGCSPSEYRKYLESMFLPGMSWENHGSKWHIDHVVPCRYFDHTNEEDRKLCWHYTNTRPLWATDNLKRNDKISDAPNWLYENADGPVALALMRRVLSVKLTNNRLFAARKGRPRKSQAVEC